MAIGANGGGAIGAAARGGRLVTVVVWLLALAGSAAVVALAYAGTTDWFGVPSRSGAFAALGVVLAASVLAALGLQLATRQAAGFVSRASVAVGGAVLVVALAALALLPVALG